MHANCAGWRCTLGSGNWKVMYACDFSPPNVLAMMEGTGNVSFIFKYGQLVLSTVNTRISSSVICFIKVINKSV